MLLTQAIAYTQVSLDYSSCGSGYAIARAAQVLSLCVQLMLQLESCSSGYRARATQERKKERDRGNMSSATRGG